MGSVDISVKRKKGPDSSRTAANPIELGGPTNNPASGPTTNPGSYLAPGRDEKPLDRETHPQTPAEVSSSRLLVVAATGAAPPPASAGAAQMRLQSP